MPRQAREQSGTGIYHVILRGINRQDIFENDEDYWMFINVLAGLTSRPSEDLASTNYPCHIYAYCLMPNHIHILIREKDWKLGEIMKSIASSYVFYFNKKYGRVGHLFQNKFKSEPCNDMQYFFTLFRYINQNPVKAGLVSDAGAYRYSSWGNDYLGHIKLHVCSIQHVLRRTTFDNLQGLVNLPLPNSTNCIDMDEDRVNIADEVVRNRLLKMSGTTDITTFQTLEKDLQKQIIAMVMRELRVGPRQMSRVSGLSYSVIQRLGRL